LGPDTHAARPHERRPGTPASRTTPDWRVPPLRVGGDAADRSARLRRGCGVGRRYCWLALDRGSAALPPSEAWRSSRAPGAPIMRS
jgi:hypothetical protein